jgi:hypothetical protein
MEDRTDGTALYPPILQLMAKTRNPLYWHIYHVASHEYGKRASSGMMVGYIISMSPEKILDEVNTRQKQHCPYNPAVEFEFVKENVRQYRQKLNRKNLKPEMFKLVHLWVDLRSQ